MKQTLLRQQKSWFFKKINNIDRTLATLTKEKQRGDSNKIRSKKVNITDTDTQQIIRDYYQQLYKLDNLEEMTKLLEMYRLNHEEMENMNRSLLESIIKKHPNKQKCMTRWFH